MVKIEEAENIEQEYLQCTSCLKSNENVKMYRLLIGKTIYQTINIKLCKNCLWKLKEDIKEKLS